MKTNSYNKLDKMLLNLENEFDRIMTFTNTTQDIESVIHEDIIKLYKDLHGFRLSMRVLIDK